MADVVADGMVRVQWMPACANIQQPTLAELAAGIHMTEQITRDGLEAWEAASARIENMHLGSKHETELVGTDSMPGAMLRFKRQKPTDLVRSTLAKNVKGFVSLRRDIPYTDAFATGQEIEVFPVECGRRVNMKPEKNTLSRFEVPFAIHTTPAWDAVIA